MNEQEILYTVALTRMTGFNAQQALMLYKMLGSGQQVYEHRNDIADIVPDCTPRLAEALRNWNDALKRAAVEMEFITKHGIQALTVGSDDYPQRLSNCPDAPCH
jgi:DNA processing protein